MKTKIILIGLLLGLSVLLSGCGNSAPAKKETETINPFSPDSMVKTYDRSKDKINDAVEKENNNIENALKDSGLK